MEDVLQSIRGNCILADECHIKMFWVQKCQIVTFFFPLERPKMQIFKYEILQFLCIGNYLFFFMHCWGQRGQMYLSGEIWPMEGQFATSKIRLSRQLYYTISPSIGPNPKWLAPRRSASAGRGLGGLSAVTCMDLEATCSSIGVPPGEGLMLKN